MSNRFAVVENGLVVNVVVADAEYAAEQGWVACDSAGPGWSYSNGVFTAPPPPPAPEPTPAPTKEQLLAQLQALQAQIIAME